MKPSDAWKIKERNQPSFELDRTNLAQGEGKGIRFPSVCLKKSGNVSSTMQYPYDMNPVLGRMIEDDVISHWKTPQLRA